MILKTRIDCEPIVTWEGKVYWLHKAEVWTSDDGYHVKLCTERGDEDAGPPLHSESMDWMDCPVASRWTLVRAGS